MEIYKPSDSNKGIMAVSWNGAKNEMNITNNTDTWIPVILEGNLQHTTIDSIVSRGVTKFTNYTINNLCGGYPGCITGGSTCLCVTISLWKLCDNFNSITALKGSIRGINGYITPLSGDILSNYSISVEKHYNNLTLFIRNKDESAFSVANNTPISLWADNLSIKFT